jgi:thioredoxin 1
MKTSDIGSNSDYAEEAFTFEQINELSGYALLEFGAPWCGHCQAASSAIEEVVSEHSELRHIKIYDGKGKRLGRMFKVKLWPTLILLRDGNEVARLVRPLRSDEVRQLMSKLTRSG